MLWTWMLFLKADPDPAQMGEKKNKKTAALSEANVDELVAPGRTARKRWKSIKNKKKIKKKEHRAEAAGL